ncbi:TrmH family RNA methyltransferase [Actinopolymorpha cephalotaxi]|uniref:tRNA G18 (Ribose-2'-O)-methylase SpoU n=1 Tax=Actinopolymorpha cephalotaxi TaxID=504797 RepID=A0ABX2S361_9ACTN|nr:RNA methyltransferase [Actinopolymorpha cephalotaxi]NYH82845.1 tRNA G18 (ribose-2'-O)-methylase SpoU [Actinopolymorpha cephalotaxi]
MSAIVRLESAEDPRLGDYANLKDVTLRRSLEAEHGLFLAEGAKVIRRAVAAGYPVRSFLLSERWLDGLADVVAAGDAPCYVLPPDLLEEVTGFAVHRGAIASMERRPLQSVADVTAHARRILVLEDVVDHTNVGAIFRGAAAFGVDAIVLAPRCADPLYRRSVKVSMGTVFTCPYARMDNWYDGLEELRAAGFRLVALTPADDAVDLDTLAGGAERVALLLGTEGDGLSARWQGLADVRARIPISAEVDSLNVAAAAAVACYVLTRDVPPRPA